MTDSVVVMMLLASIAIFEGTILYKTHTDHGSSEKISLGSVNYITVETMSIRDYFRQLHKAFEYSSTQPNAIIAILGLHTINLSADSSLKKINAHD